MSNISPSSLPALSPRLPRLKFRGVVQIVQYNWPFYAGALIAGCAGSAAIRLVPLPGKQQALIKLGIAGALYFSGCSLLVSWWVYDRSQLTRWDWIARLFPTPPKRWANVHAGLDETSAYLRCLFSGSESVTLDIYDPRKMTEPSIRRARALTLASAPVPSLRVDASRLPLADNELDAAFLIFAAHEIRDPNMRLRFFEELRRVLAPGGRLLLVEHVRDLANFAAFGPGFLHFLPRSEWLRVARQGGFIISREYTITPFVHVWLLETSA